MSWSPNWGNSPVRLNGSAQDTAPLRQCGKCEGMRSPGGGVETRPGRWVCASCWKGTTVTASNRSRAGR